MAPVMATATDIPDITTDTRPPITAVMATIPIPGVATPRPTTAQAMPRPTTATAIAAHTARPLPFTADRSRGGTSIITAGTVTGAAALKQGPGPAPGPSIFDLR